MDQCEFYCRAIKRLCNNKPFLPAEYQKVEYITMSSGSYINLNISLTQGVIGKMKINVTSGDFTNSAGVKDDTTSSYNRNYFSFFYDVYTRKNVIGMGAGGYNNVQPVYAYNTDYTVAYNTANHTMTLNGVDYNFNSSWLDAQDAPYSRWNWILHGQPNASGVPSADSGAAIVYYYKLADNNNVPKRDLRPCYRKADNVTGFYDFVSSTFFENSGSGTLTPGANV